MDAHWEAHGLYHVEQQHCLISPSKILFGYIKLWGYNLVLKNCYNYYDMWVYPWRLLTCLPSAVPATLTAKRDMKSFSSM